MHNQTAMSLPHNVNYIKPKSTIGYKIVIPLCAFILHPLLGIISMFAIIADDQGFNEKSYFLLYAMIALYWGMVNTTRIPESDLLMYKNIFDSASTLSFGAYCASINKEILYFIFSYISNKVLFGNFKLYLILVTFIQFFLVLISMHKLFKNEKKYALLFAAFILFIDTRIFFSSVHLLRQMLAGSLFVYYFVSLVVDKKNKWWLIPIFVLIHSSSILLFMLTLIPKLKNRLTNRNIAILVVVFAIAFLFGNRIIALMDSITKGIPVLNYPFSRYQSIGLMEYSWYDGKGVQGIRLNLLLFYIFPIFVIYLFRNVQKKYYWIMNLCLAYYLVLEIYVASGFTYMQLRMAYYLYWFRPILLTIFIITLGKKFGKIFRTLLITLFIAYFMRRFIRGFLLTDFLIAPLEEVILNPTFMYIIDIFS